MSKRIFIDFTVFETPQKAHARISGNIEVQSLPIVGETVRVAAKDGSEIVSLSVQFISGHSPPGEQVFGLDDIVANSRDEAQTLCGKLEKQAGLEYEPNSP